MRNTFIVLFVLITSALWSCSGSDVYQGEWKATDSNGDKYTLVFGPEQFSIKKEGGDSTHFKYSQHSIKIENSVRTYGITLDDGRTYNVFFPIANDVSKGLMTLESGQPVYTISRTSYLSYDDIYKLTK